MTTPEGNAVYLAALKRSEDLRGKHLKAADEVYSAVLSAAHEIMMASKRTLDDARNRDRATALAGDGRQRL